MLKPFAICCALVSTVAAAQPYTVLPASSPYQPIVGGTPVTFTSRGGSATDEGYAEVQLGFSFPYWGQTYTSVFVDTNGFLKFGSACTTSCISGHTFPQVPPIATAAHNVIAGWWDDLDNGVSGQVRYLASPGQIDIEYSNWSEWLDHYRLSFKITLTSAGVITFHYGDLTPLNVTSFDVAYVGIDDLTGANGVSQLPCGTNTGGCPISNWPAFPGNNLIAVGSPPQAELSVASVALSNVVDSAGTLSMTVLPTFRNAGRTAAGPSLWRAWLSTDKVKSVDDVALIASAPAPGVPIQSTATASANGSAPSPAAGSYYVLVEIDFTNVVVEATELNNVGSTDVPLIQGRDLQAVSIQGPANAGPDTTVAVPVVWRNQGIQAAGAVDFRVVLSADNLYQPTDFVAFSGTRTVSGGQTISETLGFNMPPNSPGGDFSWLLVVDPANLVSEISEANNVAVSPGKVNIRPADLVNAGFELLDPNTNSPTRLGYFGEPSRMRFNLQNTGGADAKNFKVGLVISTDANLSLLSDTLAGEQTVPLLASGASQQLVVDFNLPLVDQAGAPFKTGTYFLYGVVDSRSNVFELTKGNNNVLLVGAVTLNAPAADLTVSRVQAPPSAGVGELVPVLRELRNLGNRPVSDARYRYYASANPIISEQDFPLSIQAADGTVSTEGSLPLSARDAQVLTEVVRLPANMPSGTFYIGVVVDPANAVPEFDETNNFAYSAPVLVAPAALRVDTATLLDGVQGRPYQVRLSAVGTAGAPVSWAQLAAQGALPDGLTLMTDGTLSGTPTQTGVFAFTVTATQGARVATARLALRVLAPTSEVEITDVALLPLRNSTTIRYETRLGASGGSRPYTWKLVQGTLPLGITLSSSGVLAGNPRSTQMEGAVPLTFEVQDAWGSRARRAFTLRVVSPGALVFSAVTLPDGLVGSPYDRDIGVVNADATPLATPLSFSVSRGSLPDGVRLQQSAQVALLTGSPRVAGLFAFSLTVVDARGRTDTADYLVRVGTAGLKITAAGKDSARPGETVELTLTASSGAGAQFAFEGGRLPDGVSMSPTGLVSGTVGADVVPGTYDFVVSARDGTGSPGLGAFSLRVEAPVVVAKGCSATGGAAVGWLLLAALPLLRRRPRVG